MATAKGPVSEGQIGHPARPGVSLVTVRSLDGALSPSDRPGCSRCGRPTYDPDKRGVPWVRAVVSGRQVLICPECQRDVADWAEGLDRCAACGGTRLSVQLGDVVCRSCGHMERAGA
jgi:hypothetical protein